MHVPFSDEVHCLTYNNGYFGKLLVSNILCLLLQRRTRMQICQSLFDVVVEVVGLSEMKNI